MQYNIKIRHYCLSVIDKVGKVKVAREEYVNLGII